jgi:hypothetical protein
MFPSRRRPWVQFILDHNPCLLLSTVLMLLGCYLINSNINLHAGDQPRLLALIGIINLYELCIIPLGLVLIRRARGTARDGWWLLLFEVLFLVNSTFLNVDPRLMGGWWLNLGLLLLALFKAGVLMRGLKLGFGFRTFGFLAVQLTLIYCLPIFLWLVSDDGVVPQHIMYALWWVVGLLPVAYDLLARADQSPARHDLVQTVIRRTYLIAPWVMLVIHLRFSHWAHHAPFAWADLAPVCLGLTIAATRAHLPASFQGVTRLLPVAALLLTIGAPAALEWPMPFALPLDAIRPGALVAMGVLMTYSYLISLWAAGWMAAFITLACIAFLLQTWIYAVLIFIARQGARLLAFLANLTPASAEAWGAVSVVAAFVLLALGAMVSLRRGRAEPPAS